MQFDYEQLFRDILPKLDGLKKSNIGKDKENYNFKCTQHNDKHASAYVALKQDGSIVAACRRCKSDYGLNSLLRDLGMDRKDYIIKDDNYYTRESIIKYIKEKNVGNVKKNLLDDWVIDHDYKFEDAYFYEDEYGKPILVKIKYRNKYNPEKKDKIFPQRAIVDGKVMSVSKHNPNDVPKILYNIRAVKQAIRSNKRIYLLEGEKDADTLINLGLCATTSYTGAGSWHDEYNEQLKGANVVLLKDFDEAGEKHVEVVTKKIKDVVKSLRIISWLPEIDEINTKGPDVTDWIQHGHTRKELELLVTRSLDIKNFKKFQEITEFPRYGIYGFEHKDGSVVNNYQICSFTIEYVDLIDNKEKDEEYFILCMKTSNGNIIKRTGHVNVFNDAKQFRDFLDSSALNFKGTLTKLIDLKEWIFSYRKRKTLMGYDLGGLKKINNEWLFITHEGSYNKDMILKSNVFLQEDDNYSLKDIQDITSEEIKKIYDSLLNFADKQVVFSVLGQVGAYYLNGKFIDKDVKLNHLAFFGESGAGKSTIVEKVMQPLMNHSLSVNLSETPPFGLLKLATQNLTLPLFCEEYKPSKFGVKKNNQISNILRNSYDRTIAFKGTKSQKVNSYVIVRPFVLMGEEGFLNDETALKERSNIIYISKKDKNLKSSQAVNDLMKNKHILNKLGKKLLSEALNFNEDLLLNHRKQLTEFCTFKDRPLNTFLNVMQGLHLFWKALDGYGIDRFDVTEAAEHVAKNIKENVLLGGEETKSQIELNLELIDEAISNNYITDDNVCVDKDNYDVYIHIPTTHAKLTRYIKDYNRNTFVLSKSDFIKQLKKSKYLKNDKPVTYRMGKDLNKIARKCYKLDLEELNNLELENIYSFEYVDEEEKKEIEKTFDSEK